MGRFIEYLNNCKFKTICNERLFLEALEDDMKKNGPKFEVLHHYTDEELRVGLDKAMEQDAEDSEFLLEEKDGEAKKEKRNTKTILVNGGVFEMRGKNHNNMKILKDGVKRVLNDERLELLQNGWSEFFPIHKKNDDGSVERLGVDRRDVPDYRSKGYELGWGEKTHIFNKETGKYKPVYSEDLPRYITDDPECIWKVFEPIFISKLKDTKKGNKTTDIRKIDKTQLNKWEKEGYKAGIEHDPSFFNSFSIQESGGKVATGNFSLTPGSKGSCPSGIPCDELCYAKSQYNQYPACKEAWDKNFKLIKEHPDWLVRDMDDFFNRHPSIKLFRWHVAGDLIDANHLKLINEIAHEHDDVTFWLYTKNLDALKEFGNTHESNLIILISAWNGWRIDDIDGKPSIQTDKNGKEIKVYDHTGKDGLHKYYPVAYFDDFSHKDLIPDDDHSYVCKCANYTLLTNEDELKCKTCKTDGAMFGDKTSHPCYSLKAGECMIFRKH